MDIEEEFDYGTHETLVLQDDDEAERESNKKLCNKKHEHYIPVMEFNREKLPKPYRHTELVDFIRILAQLTVMIEVKYCSQQRPDNWAGKPNTRYPGAERRGRSDCCFGSGRIADVYPSVHKEKVNVVCDCGKCNGACDSWTVIVFTATHVVYDKMEAENSSCRVFFDSGSKNNCKEIHLKQQIFSNDAGDLCFLAGAICDQQLARQLEETMENFHVFGKRMREIYLRERDKRDKKRLVVVISHPHGQHKKVSLSFLKQRHEKEIKMAKGWFITYKALTCAGSSGAPVYVYGQDWYEVEIMHSGCNSKVNYSTSWCPDQSIPYSQSL
ncbi:hypothetical protein Btru_040980 [Bulinus truncatus]|nr:hypothetical protein Btru_040980 [Bulinus truncatus]